MMKVDSNLVQNVTQNPGSNNSGIINRALKVGAGIISKNLTLKNASIALLGVVTVGMCPGAQAGIFQTLMILGRVSITLAYLILCGAAVTIGGLSLAAKNLFGAGKKSGELIQDLIKNLDKVDENFNKNDSEEKKSASTNEKSEKLVEEYIQNQGTDNLSKTDKSVNTGLTQQGMEEIHNETSTFNKVYCQITDDQFVKLRMWIRDIERQNKKPLTQQQLSELLKKYKLDDPQLVKRLMQVEQKPRPKM